MNTLLTRIANTTLLLTLILLLQCLLPNFVYADDDCKDLIADWQPREVLKKRLEKQGWVVHRIRIDDRCYEVRAIDAQGRRVEAKFSPASLKMLEFEVEDEHHHRPKKDDQPTQPDLTRRQQNTDDLPSSIATKALQQTK